MNKLKKITTIILNIFNIIVVVAIPSLAMYFQGPFEYGDSSTEKFLGYIISIVSNIFGILLIVMLPFKLFMTNISLLKSFSIFFFYIILTSFYIFIMKENHEIIIFNIYMVEATSIIVLINLALINSRKELIGKSYYIAYTYLVIPLLFSVFTFGFFGTIKFDYLLSVFDTNWKLASLLALMAVSAFLTYKLFLVEMTKEEEEIRTVKENTDNEIINNDESIEEFIERRKQEKLKNNYYTNEKYFFAETIIYYSLITIGIVIFLGQLAYV